MAKRPVQNDAVPIAANASSGKENTTSAETGEHAKSERDHCQASHPIVGMVASAGGLEAFKKFFAAVPPECGMAFILVPHLDTKHDSSMVSLLKRQTSMPVVEAIDGMPVEINSVYVIPPNRDLAMVDGKLVLSSLPEPLGSKTAIDSFLRSLAVDQEECAIGIVLSGTGCHGTLGIAEIKRCGGMAIVQSPESAQFDQMPSSAIKTGLVDFVLAPELMPETLIRYIRHPYVSRSRPPLFVSESALEQLGVVLELILKQTKFDFRNYRPKMIMRRIERRMGLNQLDDFAKYVQLLREQPQELDALRKDLLIGVTSFFREPEAFAVLEKELFPKLVGEHTEDRPLRVWVPSCATGEEAYTIAMLLLESFAAAGKPANIQIFASDVNQQSIDIARRGVYPASVASDIEPARMQRFFVATDENHFQVNKQLRDSIIFSKHNVISDAPFSKVDLISCRNLLIYLEPEMQEKLISLFHYALVENGLLLLGSAETIGRATDRFEPISKKWRVYRRTGPPHLNVLTLPIERSAELLRNRANDIPALTSRKSYKELTEIGLREHMPAAALINRHYEILYVVGPLGDYLEFPTGELSKNLLALARVGLRTRLRAACYHALTQRIESSDFNAHVQRNGTYVACSIKACPVVDPNSSEALALIVLQDRATDPGSSAKPVIDVNAITLENNLDSPSLAQILEHELKATRDELQTTIEEMESFNEELQSSNEELESAKEELQSLNEELSTVNFQLLEKVSELDKSTSEITNLMASTEIAALYLDKRLRINRFTLPAATLLNLLVSDEGRDIRDFSSPLVDYRLQEECNAVLSTLQAIDAEIQLADDRVFLRRILPFRTIEGTIEGIVVTFIDLTAHNRTIAEQRERDACFREIFDHAATGIAIASLQGIFVKCNPSFCKLVGYTESELSNIHFLSLVHSDDRQRNGDWLLALQSGEVSSYEIENRYTHKNGSPVNVRKFVSVLPDGSGKASLLLALVTDISVQCRTLDALRQSEERIRTILKTASDAIITFDNNGLIDSVNESTEKIFGYAQEELVGQNLRMLMPSPFSGEQEGFIKRFLASNEPHISGMGREVVCRRKDGTLFPADLAVSQVNHLGLFTGILRDISSLKEMQRHILEIASEEQRRIGFELHDGTQQELTGLSLYANALQETIQAAIELDSADLSVVQFRQMDFERLKHTASLLTKRIAETNEHVRDLAHGIMPVQIDAEGLRSALMELVASLNSTKDVRCEFEQKGEISIRDNTTATHLYRIAQEAVTNALRHGSADYIKILLVHQDNRIVLEISDNGRGFDSSQTDLSTRSRAGMGMRTMKYRASLIGGRLQVQRARQGGTLIHCELLRDGETYDG